MLRGLRRAYDMLPATHLCQLQFEPHILLTLIIDVGF